MNDYATEEEQVEALKRWWDENGKFVIGGVVLGVGALVGWNYYSSAQQTAAEEASMFYQTLLDKVRDGEADAAQAAFDALQQEHAGSTYAAQAWLAAAKLHMDAGDTEAGINALTRMLDTDAHSDLKVVARLRLAQAYFYVDRFDDAYAVLQPITSVYQRSRVDEMIGDIEAARGNVEAARIAYESALATPVEERSIDPDYVGLKLAQLPPPPAAPSADEPPADIDAPAVEAETETP
ncbi:MAG: tetratricopeptide repeat protein [Pseudomonadota bacterium]